MASQPMNDQQLLDLFKTQVCDRGSIIDPGEEYDWFSLSIGFFLAQGIDIDRAHDLALKARYDHEYWTRP